MAWMRKVMQSNRSPSSASSTVVMAWTGLGQSTPDPSSDSSIEEREVESVQPKGRAPFVEYSPTFEGACARYDDCGESCDEEMKRTVLAFKRFCVEGTSEVPRDCMHSVLVTLGFSACSKLEADSFAEQLSTYELLDWSDFCDVVGTYSQAHRVDFHRRAGAFLEELRGRAWHEAAVSADELQRFLRSWGVFVAWADVENALALVSLETSPIASVDDLVRLVAALRVNEGFSAAEVAAARKVFDSLERHQKDPSCVKARRLKRGLMKFEGLYCVDNLAAIMQSFPSVSDSAPCVSFYEFLAWARQLRYMGMQQIWERFAEAEPSAGMIPVAAAVHIAARMGYTLTGAHAAHLLRVCGAAGRSELNFDGVAAFLQACRRSYGFSSEELAGYVAAFNQFDRKGSGELTSVEVLELLRHLGYDTRPDQVHTQIRRVDFNENHTMCCDEYLMLMRFMYETFVQQARTSFNELQQDETLSCADIQGALASLGDNPPKEILRELTEGAPAQVSFESFLQLAWQCRQRSTVERRKRAGFSDDLFRKLSLVFSGPGRPKLLTLADLLGMLSEWSMPVNTPQGRRDLLSRVESARRAAVEAGASAEEVGPADGPIGFFAFVQLVRNIVREREQDLLRREQEALRQAGAGDEPAYRHVFAWLLEQLEEDDGRDESRAGKRRGAVRRPSLVEVLAQITVVPTVPEKAIAGLAKSLGLQLSAQQLATLNAKVRASSAGWQFRVHFAGFVGVAHWMFQATGVSACAAAERVALKGHG